MTLIIEDYVRQGYEYTSERALQVLHTYGGPFWVTVDPYLPSPLPNWAIAAILARGEVRFPRLTFGHEWWQLARQASTRGGYIDIRRRARYEFNGSPRERQIAILAEIQQLQAFLPEPLRVEVHHDDQGSAASRGSRQRRGD